MPNDRLDPSTIESLRGGRYTPTEATLDRLSRSARSKRKPLARANFWRSRLALVLTLVFGIGLSTTGGALAVSGISSSGNAATAQYCQPGQKQNPKGKCVPNCDKGQKTGNKHCDDALGMSETDGRKTSGVQGADSGS